MIVIQICDPGIEEKEELILWSGSIRNQEKLQARCAVFDLELERQCCKGGKHN